MVAPGAGDLEALLGLAVERVRGVEPPAERCGYTGTLALMVGELEILHGQRPIEWLLAGCGVLRLPLLLEMRLLHGVHGLALPSSLDLGRLLSGEKGLG